MKGTGLGPSDLESPQESAPGDTYIIYFKLVLKCGRIAQGHLKTAQDHLKWTSKQPMSMHHGRWYASSVYNDENNQNKNTTWGATEGCEWVSNPSYNVCDEIIIEFYVIRNVRWW